MSNRFFIALMCMATLFMACNNEKKNNENEVNPDEGKSKYKGTWLTSPNQLDELLLDTVKNFRQIQDQRVQEFFKTLRTEGIENRE